MKRDIRRRIMALPTRDKLTLAWRIFRHPEVPPAAKAVMPGTLLYLASPIDVLPDFIPLVGQIDDLLVIGAALGLILWITPRHVLERLLDELEWPAVESAGAS
jgi:uncharacterized membrane protein YkvA (DUF1232 family)